MSTKSRPVTGKRLPAVNTTARVGTHGVFGYIAQMEAVDGSSDTGAAIRETRHHRGISLRELARRVSVSPGTVSAVETGKVGVTLDRLRSIAAALEAPVTALIQGVDAENPQVHDGPEAETTCGYDSDDWRSFAPLSLDPVLRAAIDAFVATGYHGATVRSIAARAGMSVPGVYHHYRSKQQLLLAILELTMDDLLWRVLAARAEGTGSGSRVALVVEALALFHTYRHDLAFIGAGEMRSLQPSNRRRIADLRNTVQHLLDTEIADGVRDGAFGTASPHTAGRAIATMCTSLPQWFNIDGTVTPEAVAAEYSRLALAVLCHDRHAG